MNTPADSGRPSPGPRPFAHFVDYLLTWNCRHIANPEIQARIAEQFQPQGLFLPFICTPDELLGDYDD